MHLVMQHSFTIRIIYLRLACELVCFTEEGTHSLVTITQATIDWRSWRTK